MKLELIKTPHGFLTGAGEDNQAVIRKFRIGDLLEADIRRPRNNRFHRKFFAMLKFAFEHWDQEMDGKSFDRFRRDVIILAGYYDMVIRLNGKAYREAKSISFANMDEDEFSQLYDRCADVILRKILTTYTRRDLDRVVMEHMRFMGFAA